MTHSRRTFLANAAAAGTVTILPFTVRAAGHAANVFETSGGPVTVHPIAHASIVLETPVGVIYVDPVGAAAQYEGLPAPDLVLVTHEHGDHYNLDLLLELITVDRPVPLVTNPAVFETLPKALTSLGVQLANGGSEEISGATIDAVPAYNITEGRTNYHPQGRDNGYVLTIGDFRIYISGDTEDIPEMRALTDIDLCFLCMNLPFTMDATAAASAVQAFTPTYVYPYHYRGRDDGTQDPAEFAELAGDATEVKFGEWYN